MFGEGYIKIGKLFGIPFGIAYSFLLLFTFIALVYPQWLLIYGIAFICVTVHEFGHALMARRLGIECDRIILNFLGGAAMLKFDYQHTLDKKRWAKEEFLVSAAGPATNIVMALLGAAFWELGITHYWLSWFININIMLLVFNLLPIFPMDGGRLFRAGFTRKIGFRKATVMAGWVARTLIIALAALALAAKLYLILIIAIALFFMGEIEVKMGVYNYDILTGKRDDIY